MKLRCRFIFAVLIHSTACIMLTPTEAANYDLRTIRGIEAFSGSAAASNLLSRNGFVVAEPSFKQIFEPYIKSPATKEPTERRPMGESLPSFITTDSGHTYHVLLEEGVKDLEQVQSRRLADFSRRLWVAARREWTNSKYGDLQLFCSVGLALQDGAHRNSLGGNEKRIAEALRSDTSSIEMPIGFPLAPVLFRAQSFYTQSPELSDYFAARQWYASVVFRLSNARETALAVALAQLVAKDPELLRLWKQLSEPLDGLLGPAEDGTIVEYCEAANSVGGRGNPALELSDSQIAELQRSLAQKLPFPRVSDQWLSPEQYVKFANLTRGFRLLPPRRLPCAVCFQKTVDPNIPSRRYPSGLDFFAASPVLRSPAAVRALEGSFGRQVAELVMKTDCGPMPDSLHGDAMRLLALLQRPLPPQVAAAFRTEAWSDLQLWTQLGAWAEQRHTWALHAKISVSYMGIVSPPKGLVAPYPDFFLGLASLTRRTAAALAAAGLEQPFDVKTAAANLLQLLELQDRLITSRDERNLMENSGKLEQLGQFQRRYYEYEQHRAEFQKASPDWKRIQQQWKDVARRCSTAGQGDDADIATLKLFYESRHDICRLARDFEVVKFLVENSLSGAGCFILKSF
jgi:Protein of unknown function (DUF3160)